MSEPHDMSKTLAVTNEVYDRLKALKICERDTFSDVIERELNRKAGDE